MSECSVKKSTFRGWDALEMQNGIVRLVAVPDIGGRIMAYDLVLNHPVIIDRVVQPLLYVDPDLAGKLFSAEEHQGDGSLAAWKNYGGDKTWPSPQGWDTDDQWHGPPDPVLDTGKYQADYGSDAYGSAADGMIAECAWIEMRSPADRRTGLQITRRFTLQSGSSRVDVRLSFQNISQRTIKWSIWDVIQFNASRRGADGSLTHDPDCSVTAKLNPDSQFENGYNVMFGAADNPQWGVDRARGIVEANYRWEIGKIGIDTSGGWAAFNHPGSGCAFTELFKHDPAEEYPDQGVGVECWTVGRGQVANLDYEQTAIFLMEVEVLSPFYSFLPGEVKTFEIAWGLSKVTGQVLDATPGGCSTTPFTARRLGGSIHLSGAFGVYDVGELLAQSVDADGQVLSTHPLMAVTPDQPLLLAADIEAAPGAVSVQLRVKTQPDGRGLILAESKLKYPAA